MKKLLLIALTVITAFQMTAQITITDDDLQGGQTYNWTSDNEYILDGLVYLESGATLNIQPGTVIKGKESPTTGDNTSSLVITRGATINATGEKQNPIIFTAETDNLNGNLLPSDCGKWGGLIILGSAPAFSDGNTEIAIEGISSGESRGLYGGTDEDDNSGILQYVSIRHSGVGIAAGSEIQGLTLGGVGRGTTIDYVEVYSSCDDGIEIFGGTVEIRHFSVAFATDDSYDLDLGWRGNGQYLFAIQQSGTGDAYDKVAEWDGAKPDDAALYSKPDMANMTLIGPGQNSTGAQNAVVMRDAWGGNLYNSILSDFPGVGIEVEDLPTGIDAYSRLDSNIVIANNTWAAFAGASTVGELVKVTDPNNDTTDSDGSELIAHLNANNNSQVSGQVVAGISRFPGSNGLDPRPNTNYGNVATVPSTLTQESFRGAFDPNEPNWLTGWSALDAYDFLGDLVNPQGVEDLTKRGFDISSITPNPASNQTTIQIEVPENAELEIMISDISGRILRSSSYGKLTTGTYHYNMDVSNFDSGIYMITLISGNGQLTKKLSVN